MLGKFDRSTFQKDFIAGVTVAVVALPLALGFGVTSGMSAAAGLTTAIFAGMVAAIFGGSRFQVSGPTGAMTVVLIPIVGSYGVGAIPALGVIAGSILVLMWGLRLGRIINRVPWTVVEGFTVGIAMVIALQQLPLILGVPKGQGGGSLPVALNTIRDALDLGLNWKSISLVLFALVIKFGYPPVAKRVGIRVHLPASFISIVLTTLLSYLLALHLPTIGEIPRRVIQIPTLHWGHFGKLLIPALMIAILAAVESLLSARVADTMAHSEVKFNANRELFGQGIATIAASLLGGMPATGAIARTSVNVRSHAQTRLASFIHAVVLLMIALAFGPLVSKIPAAAIAGVLLGTSYRILNPASMREAFKTTAGEISVLVVTSISVLAINLMWGMAIGIALHVAIDFVKRLRMQ